MDKLQNAKMVEPKGQYGKDTIYNATIILVEDGKIRNFVKNTAKWSNPDQECFLVKCEVRDGATILGTHEEVHPYTLSDDGTQMYYTPLSWYGKFKAKYEQMPEAGMQVKFITNEKGFGKIKVE